MWVVMRLRKFSDFECTPPIRWSISIDPGKVMGFLGVYTTREDAEVDYPDGPFQEITEVEMMKAGGS